MAKERKEWYTLDNAGVLYSALQTEKYSAIFRFSARMTHRVDPQALQRAVDRTMPRFPTFCVRMKRGLFWNYLEHNDSPGPFVRADISNPCQPIRYKEDNGWLIRFFYYENRIALEGFHVVTDGAGAITFFRTILAVYLREMGYDIPNSGGVLDIDAPSTKEEREDAYARYAGKKVLRPHRYLSAYQNTGTPEPFYTFHTTMGLVPVDQLKARAKARKVSITEYLTAALLKTILDKQAREGHRHQKPVALAIPINLRPWFPSETLRNFILTVRPVIDPALGEYTFEDIAAQVHYYLRLHINHQRMRAVLTGNVRVQSNKVLSMIPNGLKSPWVALGYKHTGVRPFSGTYTNPGAFTVPVEMEPHIGHMEVVLGQATKARVHCASISYGNTMAITFAGTVKQTDTEREFFRFLVQDGIHVKIESNRTGQPVEEKGGEPCPIA